MNESQINSLVEGLRNSGKGIAVKQDANSPLSMGLAFPRSVVENVARELGISPDYLATKDNGVAKLGTYYPIDFDGSNGYQATLSAFLTNRKKGNTGTHLGYRHAGGVDSVYIPSVRAFPSVGWSVKVTHVPAGTFVQHFQVGHPAHLMWHLATADYASGSDLMPSQSAMDALTNSMLLDDVKNTLEGNESPFDAMRAKLRAKRELAAVEESPIVNTNESGDETPPPSGGDEGSEILQNENHENDDDTSGDDADFGFFDL